LEKVQQGDVFTGSQAAKKGIVFGLDNIESVWIREFKGLYNLRFDMKNKRNWEEKMKWACFGVQELKEIAIDEVLYPQIVEENLEGFGAR
jgi:ClpP class serine protease